MAAQTPEDTPLGIKRLQSLERVTIRQQTAAFPNHKYVVLEEGGEGGEGRELLYAREDAGLVDRVLGGRGRPFQIHVFDTEHREVMVVRRPYSVGGDKLEVAVLGAPVAVVRRELTFVKPVLAVLDPAERPLLRVKGPAATAAHCDFQLYSASRELIGVIGKRWSGAARRPRDDCFAVRFPRDMDVRHKAAVIATCFLIDFLIFDN